MTRVRVLLSNGQIARRTAEVANAFRASSVEVVKKIGEQDVSKDKKAATVRVSAEPTSRKKS